MQYKICFIVLMGTCLICHANAQIGVVNTSPPNLAVSTIGISSNYGKSTLPVCTPGSVSCSQAFTYTFTGNGNWTIESNWEDNAKPPAILPQGAKIIIDPVPGGECVLNITQTISVNASIIIKAGKKLKLLTHLVIQQ